MSAPRFSIVLPTRDRLELLQHAVETVRRQDDPRWEIIVQDNASSSDVRSYVTSLQDPRVRFARSDHPLSVTDNWNRALDRTTGAYVVMLGDDDALVPGYLSRIERILTDFAEPDVVYTGAYHLGYPGVFPERPEGFLFEVANVAFLRDRAKPFLLPRTEARRCVNAALRFRRRFAFNMQHFVMRRACLERVRARTGTFFESPYPDFYAACAVFLLAETIVAVPEPLAIIGITPRSYGAYYFSGREAEGDAFLRGATAYRPAPGLDDVLLPGSDMYTHWLVAMDHLVKRFGDEFGLALHPLRYRLLQVLASASRGDPVHRGRLRDRLHRRELPLESLVWLACRVHEGLSPATQRWLRDRWESARRRVGGYRVTRDLGSPVHAVAAFDQLQSRGSA